MILIFPSGEPVDGTLQSSNKIITESECEVTNVINSMNLIAGDLGSGYGRSVEILCTSTEPIENDGELFWYEENK